MSACACIDGCKRFNIKMFMFFGEKMKGREMEKERERERERAIESECVRSRETVLE